MKRVPKRDKLLPLTRQIVGLCRAVRGLSNYMFHEAQRMAKVRPPRRLENALSLAGAGRAAPS